MEPGEKVLAGQYAGWVDREGFVTKGELVVTDRRLFFLPNGWRKRPDFFPEFDLSWPRVASVTIYPVKGAAHVFVRSRPGPPLETDAWTAGYPRREPGSLEWRFWASNMHLARFAHFGLKAAGLVEAERHVWAPNED